MAGVAGVAGVALTADGPRDAQAELPAASAAAPTVFRKRRRDDTRTPIEETRNAECGMRNKGEVGMSKSEVMRNRNRNPNRTLPDA